MNIEELKKYIKDKLVSNYDFWKDRNSGFIIENDNFSELNNYTVRCNYNDVIYKKFLAVSYFDEITPSLNPTYYTSNYSLIKIVIDNYLLTIFINSPTIIEQKFNELTQTYNNHYCGPPNIENVCENFIPMFVERFKNKKIYDLPIKLKKALMLV